MKFVHASLLILISISFIDSAFGAQLIRYTRPTRQVSTTDVDCDIPGMC